MSYDWKHEIIDRMEMKLCEISRREWILLLLGVDGGQPIVNEYTFHVIFYIYSFSPFDVKPLIATVFSKDIHNTIRELINDGIVERRYSYDAHGSKEVYSLSIIGEKTVEKLISRVKKSWVLINNIVVRKGETILDELVSLKRTYNDRDPKTILKLLLNYIKSESSSINLRFEEDELRYLKKIAENIKV
ncbi:MAG: hypothetical protein DRJ35_03050 [Thermoprotei archaeon]|nr:MAG: hypothetical protein DRJ35_03050 [Thermoprotei archaeon]